jgi:hypothetical protein
VSSLAAARSRQRRPRTGVVEIIDVEGLHAGNSCIESAHGAPAEGAGCLRGNCFSATDQRFNAVSVCWTVRVPLIAFAMMARATAPTTRAFLSRDNTVSMGRRYAEWLLLLPLLLLLPGAVSSSSHPQRGGVQSPRLLLRFTFESSVLGLGPSASRIFARRWEPHIPGPKR